MPSTGASTCLSVLRRVHQSLICVNQAGSASRASSGKLLPAVAAAAPAAFCLVQLRKQTVGLQEVARTLCRHASRLGITANLPVLCTCRNMQDEMFEVPDDFNLLEDPLEQEEDQHQGQEQHEPLPEPSADPNQGVNLDLDMEVEQPLPSDPVDSMLLAPADSNLLMGTTQDTSHQDTKDPTVSMGATGTEKFDQEGLGEEEVQQEEGARAAKVKTGATKQKAGGLKRRMNQTIIDELDNLQIRWVAQQACRAWLPLCNRLRGPQVGDVLD